MLFLDLHGEYVASSPLLWHQATVVTSECAVAAWLQANPDGGKAPLVVS